MPPLGAGCAGASIIWLSSRCRFILDLLCPYSVLRCTSQPANTGKSSSSRLRREPGAPIIWLGIIPMSKIKGEEHSDDTFQNDPNSVNHFKTSPKNGRFFEKESSDFGPSLCRMSRLMSWIIWKLLRYILRVFMVKNGGTGVSLIPYSLIPYFLKFDCTVKLP